MASVTLPGDVLTVASALFPAATAITMPSVMALLIASSRETAISPLIETFPTAGRVV